MLTEGDENDLPPILPPDLAARASPGAEKATAATAAATANFFDNSEKTSHLFSPSPLLIRSGKLFPRCGTSAVRASAAVVPENCDTGVIGTKAATGPHADKRLKWNALIFKQTSDSAQLQGGWLYGYVTEVLLPRYEVRD